jgi:monofunctional glycosyltransferase
MNDEKSENSGPPQPADAAVGKNLATPPAGVPVVFGAPEEPTEAASTFEPTPPPPQVFEPEPSVAPPPQPQQTHTQEKTAKEKKSERQRKGIAGRIFSFAAKAVLAVMVLSVLWVLAYRVLPIPGTVLMAQRAMQGQDVRRTPVPLSRISPHLARAVIAAEDSSFCKHDGFDFDAINMALEANENGKKLRGGSTISQQTAKNVFLWQDRNIVRKAFEAYYTLLVETLWPKTRIMEAYLNSIEFGRGYFGAEAAARGYFGKSAEKLTTREAASLAAILPSPNKWKAVKPGPYVARRINTIQKRMAIVRRDGLAECVITQQKK